VIVRTNKNASNAQKSSVAEGVEHAAPNGRNIDYYHTHTQYICMIEFKKAPLEH